jgi:uncharacterized SAM-binding protein YcdF (DUF218 family)
MTGGRRPRGCGCLLLLAALLAAWLARAAVLTAIGGFLVTGDRPAPADAIVVLSGAPAERVHEAADLFREGWAPRVLVTAPAPRPAELALARLGVRVPTEQEGARAIAVGLGVPASAFDVVPGPVDSTAAEARALRALAAGGGWRRVLVVTSPYHTRRVRGLFRRALGGVGVEVLVVPSRHSDYRPGDWWRDRTEARNLVVEYQKLLFYALTGSGR